MKIKKDLDLLFVSVPLVFPHCPPIGPAILRSQLRKHGWTSDTIDLNIELYLQDHLKFLFNISNDAFSFHPPAKNNYDNFLEIYNRDIKSFFQEWSKKIVDSSPKRIGLSLFSNQSAYFAERLIHEIRSINSKIPIVLGGPYSVTLVTRKEDRNFFPDDVDVIAGDSELSIIEYLKGNKTFKGINSPPEQLQDLELIPLPEYDKIQFEKYDQIDGTKRAYITASRGCIRRCSFCDVKNIWPKYKYRSAEKIYEEIEYLNKKFGRQNFNFTDSLVNGNVKVLKELCELIVKNKLSLKWSGHFICRNEKIMPPDLFQLLADSGCHDLSIGVESGSERVRESMRKHFTDEEIFYNLKQLTEVGVNTTLLMLVGYMTEDEEAFQETLSFFDKCIEKGFAKSSANPKGTIRRISLGTTMSVIPDTEAVHILHNINPESPIGFDWSTKDNTRFIRLERLFRTILHLHKAGHLELIGSSRASIFLDVWSEFQKYDNYEKVNRKEVDSILDVVAVNSI